MIEHHRLILASIAIGLVLVGYMWGRVVEKRNQKRWIEIDKLLAKWFHPNLATLTAYIDGKLDSEHSRAIFYHLVRCADCYEVYTATKEIRNDLVSPPAGPD